MAFEASKHAAAQAAVKLVEDGMVVGLGTGSTAMMMVQNLAARLAERLRIQVVPTSEAIAVEARRLKLPILADYPDFQRIDLTLDGADEVDPQGNMIKGGGGALLREKLVAVASGRLVIMVDESKRVERLGQAWPVPVEVVPFGWGRLQKCLQDLGGRCELRANSGKPVLTDHGNFIIDCHFGPIAELEELESRLKRLTGVVETGLFLGMANALVVGAEDGNAQLVHYYPTPPNYLKA